MTDLDAYELLDYGQGRKLERFGDVSVDRPSPAAEGAVPTRPQAWKAATVRFERTTGESGRWSPRGAVPASWSFCDEDLHFLLKPTPFGHVGLFPEQRTNWRWIRQQVARRPAGLRVLNLFAYTGGSTLAAAAAGAAVTHVDAARNVVQWARQNAAASDLQTAPIRWITEDASRFVTRELRRGQKYDALILDPPSYGHGPKGETWKLSSDLLPLLKNCRSLLGERPAFVLLTCHSPGFGAAELGVPSGIAVWTLF